MTYFYILLDSICKNVPILFASILWEKLNCSFLVMFLSGFGVGMMLASYNELGIIPPSSVFWKSFCRVGMVLSLNVWFTSLMVLFGPGIFVCEPYSFYVSRNLFHLSSWVYWHKVVYSIWRIYGDVTYHFYFSYWQCVFFTFFSYHFG